MRLCVLGSSRLTVTVSWTTTVEHGSLKKERRGPLVATDSGESPTALMASPLIAFQKIVDVIKRKDLRFYTAFMHTTHLRHRALY